MATLEGDLVAEWRAFQELTQEAAAERCADDNGRPMSRSHYRAVESGRNSPRVATLLRIIRGLDVPGKTDRERLVCFFLGPKSAWSEQVAETAGRAIDALRDLRSQLGARPTRPKAR